MVGRKLTFDREKALTEAMDLFWEKGYNATGLNELLSRMGLKRQSLYNTFGSKRQLFLEAIAHYGKTAIQGVETQLLASGSPLKNIHHFFAKTTENAKILGCRGCFTVNTMVELAPHDPQVAAEVEQLSQRMEQVFLKALQKAIAVGELPADFPSETVSRYLYHLLLGLQTRTKGIPDPAHLQDTIDFALKVLAD